MIDLHTHTDASDGSLSFGQLVNEARRAGLKAIAVTDHDNVESAKKITGREPLEVIPGVELSVFDHKLGYEDVHVLGLFINPKHRTLNSKLAVLIRQREEQKREMIAILNGLGYEITFDEVSALAKWGVGRPHIARLLVSKYPSDFPTVQDAFDKLLGTGRPAYTIRKNGFGLGEAISIIRQAGGISVLAHPLLYPYDADKLVSDFKRLGGTALETYYDYATNAPRRGNELGGLKGLRRKAVLLAKRHGLLESGGSDFHGESKAQKLGAFGAPDARLPALKSAAAKALK
jgi:predicted metal-dependent phosphoesterase TrpH